MMTLDTKNEELGPEVIRKVKHLKGPILIFGAGGFIGVNLLTTLLKYRKDVFGVSHDYLNNWRFIANNIPLSCLLNCDITEPAQAIDLIKNVKPGTIFNLAAYGAYSKQKEYNKIYATNFNATVDLIEALKKVGFSAYVHAGSSSEYGLNCTSPYENDELIPNTHYSVSKVSSYFLMKYYGKVEKLPVAHLRLYSAYGPWEEPDRLIPVLIASARHGKLPPLVHPAISRDFVYISDVCTSFILAASKMNAKLYGEAYNVGTGKKSSIRSLVNTVKRLLGVKTMPHFSSMPNRDWDMMDWYADNGKIKKKLLWKPAVTLKDGLQRTIRWQNDIEFDSASWNWTKRK